MTADIANHTTSNGPSITLHNLTLAFAGLTLVFALFSLLFGSRLATLQSNFVQVQNETASSEATAIQQMQTALNTAQQALETEKKATQQLRSQMAAAAKNLKKTKADLAQANQALDALKSAPPADSSSLPDTTLPAAPPATAPAVESAPSPERQQTDSSLQPAESAGSVAQHTADTQAARPTTATPEQQVSEESIFDSPPTDESAAE